MPLSDNEQRLLEELERNLYRSESDEVNAGTGGRAWDPRAIVLGSVAAVLGLGLLVLAVATKIVLLGVLGFAIIVGGVIWATRRVDTASNRRNTRPGGPGRTSGEASLLQRLEWRWNSRNHG